jgi:hypothetical protein
VGVEGQHQQEGKSPSFVNLEEVQKVTEWVRRVKEYCRAATSDADIGVISPYQVC